MGRSSKQRAALKAKRMVSDADSEILALLWFRVKQDVAQHFERFLFNQRWYRKWYGGKWNLLCSNKDIYWSPENNFVDIMADLGAIVDVIKKEDWDADKK